MEGDEGRVEERRGGREDDQNILKISTFYEPFPSTLLSSPLPPFPSVSNIHLF
jgi:hypothetical protein